MSSKTGAAHIGLAVMYVQGMPKHTRGSQNIAQFRLAFSVRHVWETACPACIVAVAVVTTAQAYLRGQDYSFDLPRATVHVKVFGPFGDQVQKAEIHLFTSDRKRDLSRPGQGSRIIGVPFGNYVVSVSDVGGGFGERQISVDTKDVWVRIGLALPHGNVRGPPGTLEINGEIRPVPTSGDWWIRVEGVFLPAIKEDPVHSGKFSVGGLELGSYLVEVFEGSKLRNR